MTFARNHCVLSRSLFSKVGARRILIPSTIFWILGRVREGVQNPEAPRPRDADPPTALANVTRLYFKPAVNVRVAHWGCAQAGGGEKDDASWLTRVGGRVRRSRDGAAPRPQRQAWFAAQDGGDR